MMLPLHATRTSTTELLFSCSAINKNIIDAVLKELKEDDPSFTIPFDKIVYDDWKTITGKYIYTRTSIVHSNSNCHLSSIFFSLTTIIFNQTLFLPTQHKVFRSSGPLHCWWCLQQAWRLLRKQEAITDARWNHKRKQRPLYQCFRCVYRLSNRSTWT